jgi:hypothetical protein
VAYHLTHILGVAARAPSLPPLVLLKGQHSGEELTTVLTFIIVERHRFLLTPKYNCKKSLGQTGVDADSHFD